MNIIKSWKTKMINYFLKFKYLFLPKYDLVFVSEEGGWILEAICKEIDQYCNCNTYLHYSTKNIPKAKSYFFAHYSYFIKALKNSSYILNSKNLVYYTHPRDLGLTKEEFINALNLSTVVFTMNSQAQKQLISQGLNPTKICTLVGAADENIFIRKPVKKESRKIIGFCLRFKDSENYKQRKNYDLIIELIKSIDFADIFIIGKGWQYYDRFQEIKELPHLKHIEIPYSDYPKYYSKMDVFVSVSKLEGGPIPLIESMMCDVFPVVSKTGFAPDIIEHGKNGFLFDVDAPKGEIIDLIKEGLKKDVKVRETVKHLNWFNFSNTVQRYADLIS